MMTWRRHLARAQKRKQTWGHTILKYQEKRQVNTTVKGTFHSRKPPDHLCDLGLMGAKY